jgi:hypothetical protein
VIGFALALVAAACGGGGSPSLTTGAARELSTAVGTVHAAVASGDRGRAVDALATLQTTVTQLRRRSQVSADRAATILAAAASAEAELGLMPTTTTSTSTTTTTTTTATPDDHPPKKKDHGPGGRG